MRLLLPPGRLLSLQLIGSNTSMQNTRQRRGTGSKRLLCMYKCGWQLKSSSPHFTPIKLKWMYILARSETLMLSKYPPAEPVALRLLAPQRGLFATVRSKSKSKSLMRLSSLPHHRQFEGEHTPGILKVLLPPRQSRGISLLD